MNTDALSRWIVAWRTRLLLCLLVCLIALAAGIPRLEVSSNNRAFFGGNNAEFRALQELDNTYTGSNSVLIMVLPPEGEAFAPATLEALRRMTDDAWQVPHILRVDSPLNYTHSRAVGEDILVEPMLEEGVEITPERAARFAELASESDALRNRLLSEDLDAYGISLRVILPTEDRGANREIADFVKDLRDTWEADYPGFSVHLTGGVLGGVTLADVARADILTLVPLAFVLVVALFLVLVGSFTAVLWSVGVIVSATVATFGFAGWTGIVLTAGTAISPLSVMVLTSASCVHLTLSWMRAEDQPDKPVLISAISDNLGPITVTTITTAIGFLGLNFAQSPPLQQMGNIVAFGLLFGLFACFILLAFGLANRPAERRGQSRLTATFMSRLTSWAIGLRKLWLVVFPVAVVLAIFGIFRIGFDDSILRYFDDRYEFRRDADIIQDRLTGLESLQFSVKAGEGASVFDPAFLADVDRFATWLEAQDGVVGVSALPDLLMDLNQAMNGDDPAERRLADTQEGNAQLMMLYELSLPVGLDLNSTIDIDRTETLVSVTLRARKAVETRDLAAAAEAWMVENTPAIATRASGLSIAFARLSERNNGQMLVGLGLVLVMVSIVMVITLRNLRMGAISLVPNLVPAILAFGLWGLMIGDVNLGSTVVTTMTFGIVVDDTVHFLMHYMRQRRAGRSVRAALEDTFSVVGAALIITTLALLAGFLVMAASGFAINQHIGILTAFVIGFALLADLLFLPSILIAIEEDQP